MSEALIASQSQRIQQLEKEAAELRAESKNHRLKKNKAAEELAAAHKQIEALAAERDQWKAKADASPGELQAKLDAATAQLRDRDHRDAFGGAVKDQLADKATIQDLWAKINYKPGEALPTPEQISELVLQARDAAPYLFKPAPEPGATDPRGSTQPAKAPLSGAQGGGRGDLDTASKTRVTYTREDIARPDWMTTNPRLAEALREGRAVAVG